uniref:Protein CIP2A homolog isoform X1 n=1 Tax=Hirondellea gigas TaxID=1518452 RepID=A0A6A7FRI5_9CRUS
MSDVNTHSWSTAGSSSVLIKKFVSASYDYFLRESDIFLTQLQRQLQVLSSVKDLSIFEPTYMETVEFYNCLEQLLTKPKAKTHFAWRVVVLIIHMTNSKPVLLALRDEVQILAVLSDYLRTEKLSRDKFEKTLNLMRKISHGFKLEHAEAWLLRLLPNLVDIIVDGMSNSSSGGGGCELVYSALATLANLCRKNTVVLNCLATWTNVNRLLYCLMSQQSSSNRQHMLLCTELYLLIHSANSAASAATAAQLQGGSAVALVLSVCNDGVAESAPEAVQLATDVLNTVAAAPNMMQHIVSFKNYKKEVSRILKQLDSCCSDTAAEAAGFLATLVRLNIEQLVSFYPDILTRAVSWIQQSSSNNSNSICNYNGCSSTYLQLLHALLHTANDELLDKQLQHFVTAATHHLQLDNTCKFSLHKVSQLIDALKLVQSLAVRKRIFALNLTISLKPELFTGLMEPLLEFSRHVELLRHRGKLVSRKDADSGCELDAAVADTCRSAAGMSYSLMNCSTSSTGSNGLVYSYKKSNDGGVLLCSEAIVRVLTVVKTLGKEDGAFMLQYNTLLNSGSLMPHVVQCQQSCRKPLVKLAVQLLYDTTIPRDSLEVLVNSTCQGNQQQQFMSGSSVVAAAGGGGIGGISSTDALLQDSSLLQGATPSDLMDRVEDVMARLKKIAENPDMSGLPLTDLVDLYEFKLAAMTHSELALHDLLSVAGDNSRLLRRSLLHARSENTRVRVLLRVWEERIRAEQKEKQSILDKQGKEARAFREQLTKEKTELERECSRIRGSLNGVRTELQGREEELGRLTAQHKEAVAEARLLQRTLEHEKLNKNELSRELQEVQSAQRDGCHQYELLQKTQATLEKAHAKQKQENGEQCQIIKDLEQLLATKQAELQEVKESNAGLMRIHDMIHNISAHSKGKKK